MTRTTQLPALFVSHGAPTVAVEDTPARRFMQSLGASLPKPSAIVIVSAHWETQSPAVAVADHPETIHDFHGFPSAYYDLRYPAPGAPEVARRVKSLLEGAGIGPVAEAARGLDHGAWVPAMLAYPDADVPVTQLSIQPHESPAYHHAVGRALRPLRDEGVLVLASGSLTHNLGAVHLDTPDAAVPDWVTAFDEWTASAVAENRVDDLLDYRVAAPFARENHPTDEHLLPLFVALGAGTPDRAGEVLHRSHEYGVLAMDAYAFN